MSKQTASRSQVVLPFPPRQLPEIDTIWIDVSTILCIPPGYISGIPRTIRMMVRQMLAAPWADIRLCVIVPDVGLAEVHTQCIEEHDAPLNPVLVAPLPEPTPRHSRSRFWYIPWTVRHQLRSAEQGVRNLWVDPNDDVTVNQEPINYPPYRPGTILRMLNLGPRDLVVSFGGMWVVPNGSGTLAQARQRQQFKYVSLIYDLIPITAPHLFKCEMNAPFDIVTRSQLEESDVLLTISEYSKQDILEHAKKEFTPIGPVEVFTLGSDIAPVATNATSEVPRQHRRPFVLTVGTIEWRKNHYGMYQAWRKVVKELGPERSPDLVMAGKPGWNSDVIIHMIKNDPLVKDKIIVKTTVSDRELDWLYKNCLFTLYPSIYEGWGLPVEESFIYGKLCITTNVTSLPEVGGEFADYVQPDDTVGIADAVIQALDVNYRRDREALIREKFRPNTWEMASEQIETILKKHFTFPIHRIPQTIWQRTKTKATRVMMNALSMI